MDTNKTEGSIQEAAGKVKEAVGDLVGDSAAQVTGKARELGGKAQQLYADTTNAVRDKTTESPLATLAVVAVASFILGVVWANSGSASGTRSYRRANRGDRYED